MEVILIDDIKGVGQKGATINVKPGFARNYLLPRRLAIAVGTKAVQPDDARRRRGGGFDFDGFKMCCVHATFLRLISGVLPSRDALKRCETNKMMALEKSCSPSARAKAAAIPSGSKARART